MKCPLCNIEARITATRNVVEHDDTPDEQTTLFVVQDISCVNPECANYNKVIDTIRNELPLN